MSFKLWKNGVWEGSYVIEDIKDLLRSHQISEDDFVWKDGWTEAKQINSLPYLIPPPSPSNTKGNYTPLPPETHELESPSEKPKKWKRVLKIFLFFLLFFILLSHAKPISDFFQTAKDTYSWDSDTSKPSNTKTSIDISGFYSGTTQLGPSRVPATITLYYNGKFVLESPLDRHPVVGNWSYESNGKVTLYNNGTSYGDGYADGTNLRLGNGEFHKVR